MTYYKVLDKNMNSCNGGDSHWQLKKGMPEITGKLVACENGYHLCRKEDLVYWLDERIFEAEAKGEVVVSDNKIVVRQARIVRELNWNKQKAMLFAADCAEHVLPVFEAEYPTDNRPRKAIEAVRLYAKGEISKIELQKTAYAAAFAAADAVYAAADADAEAAYAAKAAGYAARAADYAAAEAAYAAAKMAAYAADYKAERKWQTKKLFEYLNK